MIQLNFLTVIHLTMNDSINILISFFNNFGFEGLIVITIIYLASKGTKILDTVAKVVTISAGSTILYNNWIKGKSSGSSDNDKIKKMKT